MFTPKSPTLYVIVNVSLLVGVDNLGRIIDVHDKWRFEMKFGPAPRSLHLTSKIKIKIKLYRN
jgi:hypothetical protein